MGIADVALLGGVALWLFLVIVFMVKKKKAGECVGCSGGTCANCPKKTVGEGRRMKKSTKIYSDWSKAKSITVKK